MKLCREKWFLYVTNASGKHFSLFFLARLAFAVRASGYDTNRFSIVYINDYFHLRRSTSAT